MYDEEVDGGRLVDRLMAGDGDRPRVGLYSGRK